MDQLTIIIILLFGIIISYYYIKNKWNKTLTQSCQPSKYQYLLATKNSNNFVFDPNYINLIKYNSSPLIKCIDDFCISHRVYDRGVIVSLSGGVDSMVTLAILLYLQKSHNFSIFTATIDYGLREESHDESEFLQEYTKMFGIKSYINRISGVSRKKEDSGSRTEFEEESRNVRFNTYKQIIQENNLDPNLGVFVAHHLDDIVENIFTNSMRGANLLDLVVMKPVSKINGINIYRPFLNYKKQVILDLAHKFSIPYFLDTTPKWSKRGLMRNEIFPLLNSVFGTSWSSKLSQLGTQSNDWGNYINTRIIDPWFAQVKLGSYGVMIPIQDQPELIYNQIIVKSLHSIGEHMLKKTSVNKIIECISTKSTNIISLDGFRYGLLIKNNKWLVIFNSSKITAGTNQYDLYEGLINGLYCSSQTMDTNKSVKKLFQKFNIK